MNTPLLDSDTPASTPVPRQNSTLAVVSLVAGILGWTLVPWLAAWVAVITGHMARAEIRRNPERLEGDGLAVIGLILGWTSVLLGLFALLMVVFFFGGLALLLGWLGVSGQLH